MDSFASSLCCLYCPPRRRCPQNAEAFIRDHLMMVLATSSSAAIGATESSLVAYVEEPGFTLYLRSHTDSRKARNMRCNPRVSVVIGLNELEQATLQMEGIAREITDSAARMRI